MKHTLRTAAKIIIALLTLISGCTSAVRYEDNDRTLLWTIRGNDAANTQPR